MAIHRVQDVGSARSNWGILNPSDSRVISAIVKSQGQARELGVLVKWAFLPNRVRHKLNEIFKAGLVIEDQRAEAGRTQFYVTPSGEAYPDFVLSLEGYARHWSGGNLVRSSVDRIMNSPAFVQFRGLTAKARATYIPCSHCEFLGELCEPSAVHLIRGNTVPQPLCVLADRLESLLDNTAFGLADPETGRKQGGFCAVL